jgi:DNA-binding response OmpR family regulator
LLAAGLDEQDVDRGRVLGLLDEGFVAHRLDDALEQLAYLEVGLADQDCWHGFSLGGRGRIQNAFWYESGMSGMRVLVVDDDSDIRGLLRQLLERSGHLVKEAGDGREGLRTLHSWRPDLVLLDITMPGLDGYTTLERIRELTDVPVLMLSARETEIDKVRGLKAGADDYVTKPFGRQELLARVEALLRRRGAARTEIPEAYEDKALFVDFTQRLVRAGGEEVALTPLEYRLLSAFVRHPNQILSHEQLLELVWGDEDASREQVKLYVGYLRRKLGMPDAIESVRGFGYRYRAA